MAQEVRTLSYEVLEDMLQDEIAGTAFSDDVGLVFLRHVGDTFLATWESKRTDKIVWYVTHVYHKDGTVEELFDHEEIL